MTRARVAVALLTLSAAGLIGIAQHEGFRSQPYADAGGVLTDGFGNTRDVEPGRAVSVERALVQLAANASEAEQAVALCAPVPMHQHEFDAWVSFTFNVGAPAFCRSAAARLLREGRYTEACNEMPRWVYADGRRLRGLEIRREAERRLCLGIDR